MRTHPHYYTLSLLVHRRASLGAASGLSLSSATPPGEGRSEHRMDDTVTASSPDLLSLPSGMAVLHYHSRDC